MINKTLIHKLGNSKVTSFSNLYIDKIQNK